MSDDEVLAEVVPSTPEQLTLDRLESERINAERQLESRRIAYSLEADPLFFKWQRGEGTEQEWLDKVEEIKKRYSKIEEV